MLDPISVKKKILHRKRYGKTHTYLLTMVASEESGTEESGM